ncbi:hypothetical protein ACFXKW_37155 [Streptomyces sp. NPDC059193]|uniref:hypothetical protein n=1 Tax=Streptomyces sp. NPDC059193 TaxID=3346763 RepID=UPI0036B97CF9
MTRESKGKASHWGCVTPVVLVLVAAGIWIALIGKDMIADEPPALCGSRIMEEGETCERYSRSTGKTTDTFGADESRKEQDISKDIFGWIFVAVGGVVGLAGVGLMGLAIKYRPGGPED